MWGEYLCEVDGVSQCLPYTEQCNGQCFGGNVKCGADKCTGTNGAYGTSDYRSYTCEEADGNKVCLPKNIACNGECRDGYFKCGNECRKDTEIENFVYQCGDQCLSNHQPCNGACREGYILCGNECKKEEFYWQCGAECISNHQACNGLGGGQALRLALRETAGPTCRSSDYTLCGTELCLTETHAWAKPSKFRTCGDKCIPNSKPCDGQCRIGYRFCDNRCIRRDKLDKWTKSCDGKCTLKWKQCQNVCPACSEGWFPCGNKKCLGDRYAKYYRSCGNQCINTRLSCPEKCSTDTTTTTFFSTTRAARNRINFRKFK